MRPSIQNNISVVIPVYNEQDSIGHLIQELQSPRTALFEIVVVDDASRDETFLQLKNLQNQYPNLSVVRHKNNRGQSAAVVTGVRAAKFDWIVTLDGDGQNDPTDIPNLIEAANHLLQSGVSKVVCLGYRINRKDTLLRKLSSVIANGVRKLFLNDHCPDTGCGIKLFPKNLFLQLPHFRNCHRFLPALFKRADATLVNVAVTHRKREHGTSKYGVMNRLWVGIVDLLGVAWLMRRSIQVDTYDEL